MSSNKLEIKTLLKLSKNILVITGAGMSAESGIPTFRGSLATKWRNYEPHDLANPSAFRKNPSLVWEFYHYRRELCLKTKPNNGHLALAKFEENCIKANKIFSIITQNIDGLHRRAGSRNIIAIHGELFETKCINCEEVKENFSSPICDGLRNRGGPESHEYSDIPPNQLPRCEKCDGLLRPNVVWFGEQLNETNLIKSGKLLSECDVCLVIGTSGYVQPVASFPLEVVNRGVPVVEVNIEETPLTSQMSFVFRSPSSSILPDILDI